MKTAGQGSASWLAIPDPFPPPEKAPPQLAPRPLVDKYPLVIGAGATLAYASNVLRLCTTGYRREAVDFARELLERDGATKMLLASRFCTVAGGRIEVVPPELPDDDKRADRALEIAEAARFDVLGIPNLRQELLNIMWGCFYGVAISEIGWKRGPQRIVPGRLYTIANRRIAYPDAASWDAHIWDQGAVLGGNNGFRQPTNSAGFGLNISHAPNKFIVHAPAFAADYPTREGMMRELVPLMIMKIMGLRSGAAFIERFTKIVFWASFTTGEDHPRVASADDVDQAYSALQQLGLGSLAGATLPDSIKLHMEGPATKGDNGAKMVEMWVETIDAQITRIVRGSTFTTMPGRNVGKGVSEAGENAESQLEKFDADCLGETLTAQLLGAWMRINFPGEEDLCPRVKIHVDEPLPAAMLKLAIDGASCGIPVDADAVAAQVGLRVTPNEDGSPRRMAPIKAVELPAALLGADVARLEAELAEQEAEAAAEAQAAAQAIVAPANDNPKFDAHGEDEEPQTQAAE